MRTDTGELRGFVKGEPLAEGFERVPPNLEKIAAMKLRAAMMQGSALPTVNTLSTSPLAKWARDRQKAKRKAKIAAASRRKNRRLKK